MLRPSLPLLYPASRFNPSPPRTCPSAPSTPTASSYWLCRWCWKKRENQSASKGKGRCASTHGTVPGEAATSTSSSSPYSLSPSLPVLTLPLGVGATLSSPLSRVSALLSLSAVTWPILGLVTIPLAGPPPPPPPPPPPLPRRLPRRPPFVVGGGGGEGEEGVEEEESRTRREDMMVSSASS
jgi:hypothetical protein